MFHDCFSVLCIFGCCRLRLRANCGNSRTFRDTFDCSTSCLRRKWGRTAHCIIQWCRLRMPSSDVEGQRAVGSVRACILLLLGPLWAHLFFFAMQWCGETTCCRICPCMYPSASRVSVRPFVFHHLLTTCGTVVGDVDNPGRHARETQSSANWCAGQYIGCLSSDAIGKVDASIALDQQVSHLKFLLTNCMFLVTVCLLKDLAFCRVFYAAEGIWMCVMLAYLELMKMTDVVYRIMVPAFACFCWQTVWEIVYSNEQHVVLVGNSRYQISLKCVALTCSLQASLFSLQVSATIVPMSSVKLSSCASSFEVRVRSQVSNSWIVFSFEVHDDATRNKHSAPLYFFTSFLGSDVNGKTRCIVHGGNKWRLANSYL